MAQTRVQIKYCMSVHWVCEPCPCLLHPRMGFSWKSDWGNKWRREGQTHRLYRKAGDVCANELSVRVLPICDNLKYQQTITCNTGGGVSLVGELCRGAVSGCKHAGGGGGGGGHRQWFLYSLSAFTPRAEEGFADSLSLWEITLMKMWYILLTSYYLFYICLPICSLYEYSQGYLHTQ